MDYSYFILLSSPFLLVFGDDHVKSHMETYVLSGYDSET